MVKISRLMLAWGGALVALSACGGGGSSNQSSQPPPCDAASKTCFVRTSGSDSNSGADAAHALGTILRAAQLAQTGYTIIVGAGTYNEGVTTVTTGLAPQNLTFIADVSGTQTGDAGPVVIDASGTALHAGFKLSSANNGTIDGFTITGATDGGIVLKPGTQGGSDNFTIQNCIVHDNPGDGIRVQDSANVLVFNNLVYANGGDGLGLVGTCPSKSSVCGSPNGRILSNTIVTNAAHGVTIGTTTVASPSALVHNNIIQNNDAVPPVENIKVFTSPNSESGFDGDFNLVFPANYNPATLRGADDVPHDAAFVNPGADNFHLNTNSPAINAGGPLNLSKPQTDILHGRTTTGTNLDSGVLDIGFHFLR